MLKLCQCICGVWNTVPSSLPWAILAEAAWSFLQACSLGAAPAQHHATHTSPHALKGVCNSTDGQEGRQASWQHCTPLSAQETTISKQKCDGWGFQERKQQPWQEGKTLGAPIPDHRCSHELRSNGKQLIQLTQRRWREKTAIWLSKTSNEPFIWEICSDRESWDVFL